MMVHLDINIWVTKDGQEIPITDLSTRHLLNILKFLQRSCERRRLYYSTMMALASEPNGEMAQMDFEDACDEAWTATWKDYLYEVPQWEVLSREAERRGVLPGWFPSAGEEDDGYDEDDDGYDESDEYEEYDEDVLRDFNCWTDIEFYKD